MTLTGLNPGSDLAAGKGPDSGCGSTGIRLLERTWVAPIALQPKWLLTEENSFLVSITHCYYGYLY